ncbi:MAG: arginine--tRNA ligase [Oscillospiraceae bacterium]|nr:arginine--tRNA ligase [Oscillospiraceae bacterium]
MEKLIDLISQQVSAAFEKAGYDAALGRVAVSGRPDLCEYQCNGAMPAAKQYHKAPIVIAEEVVAQLKENPAFLSVEAVKPGFINLRLAPETVSSYVNAMATAEKFGLQTEDTPKTVVIDYGGANVAKPLHVGHIRPAIIGEAVKRLERYMGNTVIGDVHLGDWGLQMGLIIEGIREEHPELPYFDPDFQGEYPTEPPFTISQLEQIYPAASARSKVDPEFSARAHEATLKLQQGDPGYMAMWHHVMNVSVADLKKNYGNLNVDFDLWKGESDAEPYIAGMVQRLKDGGYAVESQGALVVEVQEPEDKKEIPPCIILKSDGATLYATTDLATLVQREEDYHPDKVLYVVDKRQALHFEQVFRTAKKSGIVRPETKLQFLGFGTMNGKDGKPFKTRDGGVMRLEYLISEISDTVKARILENNIITGDAVDEIAGVIAVAALKYGDLSNLATKDYAFDMDRFSAFEGNTGPYILYTIVRIKSILAKYAEKAGQMSDDLQILPPENQIEKDLMLQLSRFADNIHLAYRDTQPNVICAYIYDLASAVNRFYHETRILTEADEKKQQGYIALITLVKRVLETCIHILGFEAPEKM